MKDKNTKLYYMKKKSPSTAVWLSLLFTGFGHFYIGKTWKGFLLITLQFFLWFLLLGWIMWIIAPILAYYDTKEYNEMLKIEYNIENE